jgi:hypothetical protein
VSTYRDLLVLRQPLLDGFYGEQLLVTPWTSGDVFAGGPDPTIAPFTVIGILDIPTKVERVEGAAGVTGARSDIVQPAPRVDFAASVFAARQTPQADWRLTAIERPGAPVLKIVAAEPDGLGRILCPLLQV